MADDLDTTSSGRPNSEGRLATKPSKLRLRNFFQRRKTAQDEEYLTSHNINAVPRQLHTESLVVPQGVPVGQTIDSVGDAQPDRTLSLTSRTRSKSRSRKSFPSQSYPTNEALPFEQARLKAQLQSSLRVPTKSFLNWLPLAGSRRSSTSTQDGTIDGLRSWRLNQEEPFHISPRETSTTLVDKQFLLCTNGQIVQYKSDGEPNRLPERTIYLSKESIIFASDAITGEYWVLELSTASASSSGDQSKLEVPRSTWSVFSFRGETRPSSETLLLVFDNPELMSTWLTAIRKEIEHVGGLHYRPEIPRTTPSSRTLSSRTSASECQPRTSHPHDSRPVSKSNGVLLKVSNAEKDLPCLPSPSTYQKSVSGRSIAASSITTRTSLDRFRDTDANSTTTATTNSLDGSIAMDSPTQSTFAKLSKTGPSIEASTGTINEQFSGRDTQLSQSSQSLYQRPKSSLSSSRLRAIVVHEEDPSTTTPEIALNEIFQDPVSLEAAHQTPRGSAIRCLNNVPPPPPPPPPSRTEKLQRIRVPLTHQAAPPQDVVILAETEKPEPMDSHARHMNRPSTDSKSMYSLFPRRFAHEVKIEPLVGPEKNPIPGMHLTNAADHSDLLPTPVVAESPPAILHHTKSTRRPAPLKLTAALETDQLQRSPAVTDDMLASNFGTAMFNPTSPYVASSFTHVPSLDDLNKGFSFVRRLSDGSNDTSQPPSPTTYYHLNRRRKSTPNPFLPSSTPSAPVGPPPSAPLPAVPAISIHASHGSIPSNRTVSKSRRVSSRVTQRDSTLSSAPSDSSRPPSSYTRGRSRHRIGSTVTPERDNANEPADPVIVITDQPPVEPESIGRPSVVSSSIPSPKGSLADRKGRHDILNRRNTKSNQTMRMHRQRQSSTSTTRQASCSSVTSVPLSCNDSRFEISLPARRVDNFNKQY